MHSTCLRYLRVKNRNVTTLRNNSGYYESLDFFGKMKSFWIRLLLASSKWPHVSLISWPLYYIIVLLICAMPRSPIFL